MDLQRCHAASRHALHFHGPINNIHEAPAIGNGDLGALVQVFQNEFRLHLGKNDIWDARFDYDTERATFKQSDLIRAGRDHGFRLEGGNYSHGPVWDDKPADLEYPDDQQGWNEIFPCPKPAGCIRVLHSGSSSTEIDTTVDIATGIVTSVFKLDYGWHGSGTLTVQAFVRRNCNVVQLLIDSKGEMGAVILCLEKTPDSIDPSLLPPRVELINRDLGCVSQAIPAEHGAQPFAWSLAGAFPCIAAGKLEARVWSLQQKCALESGNGLHWAVGVATDHDGKPGTAGERATSLATQAAGDSWESAVGSQRQTWQRFWNVSGVALEDQELEACWYRNLFALNCHIGAEATAPGLCANVVPAERSPWHGGYTVNMNIQKMFLAANPTGHYEWIECYAKWLRDMEPSMEHLSRTTFDIDEIYSNHMMMPFVPPDRQASFNTCGRALGMTGWHGQPLWWHWEYTRDRDFLAAHGYPYFRRAAEFYRKYFEKFMDESGDIYPSLILEHPPWTRDFEHNRDCFTDLILIRKSFEWAIAAAKVLGLDADLVAHWDACLQRVRPVRHEWLGDGSGWIASDRNAPRPSEAEWWKLPQYRGMAMTAAWTVFPGEYVDGDETEGIANVIRDLLERLQWRRLHPDIVWIHHWWCALPMLRLGLDGAFEHTRELILKERFPAGHCKTTHWYNLQPEAWRCPEENYLGVMGVTEMLLQSQGEVLRFFPAWPPDQWASFRDLPARGGFKVSASWSPDDGLQATIHSIAGEECRIRWNDEHLPEVLREGRPVMLLRSDSCVSFNTEPGADYCVRAAAVE